MNGDCRIMLKKPISLIILQFYSFLRSRLLRDIQRNLYNFILDWKIENLRYLLNIIDLNYISRLLRYKLTRSCYSIIDQPIQPISKCISYYINCYSTNKYAKTKMSSFASCYRKWIYLWTYSTTSIKCPEKLFCPIQTSPF